MTSEYVHWQQEKKKCVRLMLAVSFICPAMLVGLNWLYQLACYYSFGPEVAMVYAETDRMVFWWCLATGVFGAIQLDCVIFLTSFSFTSDRLRQARASI